MERRAAEAMRGLGLRLDPRREVSTLSTAERQMVEIARAVMGEPQLVILDEPTSSLHTAEVEQVFDAVRVLAARGVAVIYVSHRMAEIREIAETATVVRDGRIIDTLPVRSARTADIVQMMLGKAERESESLVSHVRPDVLLAVRDLAVPPKLADVSFELHAGEVLGIAGVLGSGRTELLRAISGLDVPAAGSVRLGGTDVTGERYGSMVRRGLGLTPENRKDEVFLPLLGVEENIVMTRLAAVSDAGLLSWARVRAAARGIIRRLDIRAASERTPIGTLSGGNQQKAVIGRWLFAGSRILLLDEPTRGVDVESKGQIYAIIREIAAEGAGVIFVSSEVEELPRVCDRALVLRGGRIAAEVPAAEMNADRLMAASMAEDIQAA
jgi:simple sugar transport system ATP-binding protein